eukprot:2490918-Amphidinium_carterae.1
MLRDQGFVRRPTLQKRTVSLVIVRASLQQCKTIDRLEWKVPRSRTEHITASFATSLSNHKLPIRFSMLGSLECRA